MATSVQEQAPFDDDDGQPREDVPDYDDLIESALDALDIYQARRADMNMHLKKAFFNLAQAKLALGPARVGPASYHHGRVEPLLTVDVIPSADGTCTYTLVESKPAQKPDVPTTSKGKEQAANKRVDLRYGASTSAVTLDDPSDINEKSETGGKLRRRVQKVFKKDKNEREQSEKHIHDEDNRIVDDKGKKAEAELEDANGTANGTEDEAVTLESGDDAPPTYSESVNEFLLDPMQQFSAFPPVTLRKAQIEFRQSLRLATNLLSQQQNFSSMCSTAERKAQNGNGLELKP